eukprot:g2867.t1
MLALDLLRRDDDDDDDDDEEDDDDGDDDDDDDDEDEVAEEDKGPISLSCPSFLLPKYARIYNMDGRIGIYSRAERDVIIQKYRKKRESRSFRKRIRYSCRKNLADRRLRIKGRFVRADSEEAKEYLRVHGSLEGATVGAQNAAKLRRERGEDGGDAAGAAGGAGGDPSGEKAEPAGDSADGSRKRKARSGGSKVSAKLAVVEDAGDEEPPPPLIKRERAYTVG